MRKSVDQAVARVNNTLVSGLYCDGMKKITVAQRN
jgi:hypothetical protein